MTSPGASVQQTFPAHQVDVKGKQSELLNDARLKTAAGVPDLIKPELQAMEKFRNRGVHSVSWMVMVGVWAEAVRGDPRKGRLYGRYPRLILSSAASAVISSFNFADIPQAGAGMSSGFGGPWKDIETTCAIGQMTLSFQSDLLRMLRSEVQLDALDWQEDPVETSRLQQDCHWMRSALEEVLAAP
ncbi:hypothetical protein AK812_SmicGene48840 [Symbiodinium microadriaticum]|uniref:Uncharacterized protein n=1 Tax=Symbiodinium microadriaticum TaxID=2951 RepID=A0A1Q8ZJZ8_SYMMI|nr:hypothetical protein AK812_SmicGene48840 [Symbiodinium microadriaticum]